MAVNPPKAATAFETYLFAPVDLWNGLDIEVSQQAQTQSSHKHPLHTRVLEYLTTRDDTQTLNFSLFDSMCGIPHAASICLPDIPPEHGGPSLEEFARELKPYLQNFPLQVRKFVGKIAGIAAFRQLNDAKPPPRATPDSTDGVIPTSRSVPTVPPHTVDTRLLNSLSPQAPRAVCNLSNNAPTNDDWDLKIIYSGCRGSKARCSFDLKIMSCSSCDRKKSKCCPEKWTYTRTNDGGRVHKRSRHENSKSSIDAIFNSDFLSIASEYPYSTSQGYANLLITEPFYWGPGSGEG